MKRAQCLLRHSESGFLDMGRQYSSQWLGCPPILPALILIFREGQGWKGEDDCGDQYPWWSNNVQVSSEPRCQVDSCWGKDDEMQILENIYWSWRKIHWSLFRSWSLLLCSVPRVASTLIAVNHMQWSNTYHDAVHFRMLSAPNIQIGILFVLPQFMIPILSESQSNRACYTEYHPGNFCWKLWYTTTIRYF